MNWGARRELLSRNVAALVRHDDLPKAVKPKPLALTDAEVRKLLEEARNQPSEETWDANVAAVVLSRCRVLGVYGSAAG